MTNKAFVMTAYDGSAYIKPNKMYELREAAGFKLKDGCGYITAEDGDEIFIVLKGCAHLRGSNWMLIEPSKENAGVWAKIVEKFKKLL